MGVSAIRRRGITKSLAKEMNAWEKEGSVLIPELMYWWKNDSLNRDSLPDRFKEEFDMYLHHQRTPVGGSNYSWIRNMYHSVAQQLIRMDPAYY